MEFVKQSGETWVRWALPPTLVQGIADPQRWTSLELGVLAKLNTYAAVALYEICARFKNNPSAVTSRKPITWWVDALSNSPAPIDPSTGQPRRREWRKFKNEFVLGAVEQINENTDLEIGLLEFKQGRAGAEVQFSVRKKFAKVETLAAPVNHGLLERAQQAGLTEKEIDQLMMEWSEADISAALAKLEQRRAMTKLEEVRSAIGYMRHLLGKKEPHRDDIPRKEAPSRAAAPEVAVAPVPTSWIQTKRDEVANAIAALSKEEQRSLIHEVTDSLRARGLLTPSIARRAAQGDWDAAGILKVEMVQMYALKYFGPEWDRERR